MAKQPPDSDSAGAPKARGRRAKAPADIVARDAAADATAQTPGYEPREEDIRARAYERYVERGRADGHDVSDWLDAERELRTKGL
jgi:hypothetical protein